MDLRHYLLLLFSLMLMFSFYNPVLVCEFFITKIIDLKKYRKVV